MNVWVDDADRNEAWDAFILASGNGHHVQSYEWGLVKKGMGWGVLRIIAEEDQSVVAGAQVLYKALPVLGTVAYITKGPVCLASHPQAFSSILDQLHLLAKERPFQYIAIQPPNRGHNQQSALVDCGFSPGSLELAPTASLVLDLQIGLDGLFAGCTREMRQRINQSRKAGLTVRIGGREDLETFYQLYLSTAHRQHFTPFPRSYFDFIWDQFSPKGWVSLLIVYSGDDPVSGQLLVPFGETVLAKKIGWSGDFSRSRPNDALIWACIQWSVEHGFNYFDFEGVNPLGAKVRLDGGTVNAGSTLAKDTFKFGYGGQIVFYPGVYDQVINPVENWIYRHSQVLIQHVPAFEHLVDAVRSR